MVNDANLTTEMRTKLFTMRMSEEEHAHAERTATQQGFTLSQLVRKLLSQEAERLAHQIRETETRRLHHWRRDLEELGWLTIQSSVPGLSVTDADFDQERVSLSDGHRKRTGLTVLEAHAEISSWPGSGIIGWTDQGEPILRGRAEGTGYVVRHGTERPDRSAVYVERNGVWSPRDEHDPTRQSRPKR